MSNYFLGIDLGGTNVEVALLDEQGNIFGRESFPTEVQLGKQSMIERMAAACEKLIAQKNIAREDIKCIGIGSPGPLSVTEGKIIKAGNLPGFDNFPLRAQLSQKLQIPAVLHNDANVACWGEFWLGAGKDVTDMVMFTLGTGIGGGIICDGTLLRGSEDNGAELGHVIIQPGGRQCACGQLGCLEAYASANATALRATEALNQNQTSTMQKTLHETGAISCKDVFDHAIAGDELANEIIDGTAKALAQACVNMRHITEPQIAVLAGGMTKAGDILTKKVRSEYEKMIWTLKSESMEICLAKTGHNAAVAGAAGIALNAWQKQQLYPIGT